MEKRTRSIKLCFRVSEEEKRQIEDKMAQIGTNNLTHYLTKMAIDGYIVKLDLPELKEIISLLRRTSASTNQIAKRLNTTGRIYEEDMKSIMQAQEQIWQGVNSILTRLVRF